MFNKPDTTDRTEEESRWWAVVRSRRTSAALFAIALLVSAVTIGAAGVVVLTPQHELPIGTAVAQGDSMGHDTHQVLLYADTGEVSVGDTIVFETENGYLHHRVVADTEYGYYTQGDTEPYQDQVHRGVSPATSENIRGEVIATVPLPLVQGGLIALLALLGSLGCVIYRREISSFVVRAGTSVASSIRENDRQIRAVLLVVVIVTSVVALPFLGALAPDDRQDHDGKVSATSHGGVLWSHNLHGTYVFDVEYGPGTDDTFSGGSSGNVVSYDNATGTENYQHSAHGAVQVRGTSAVGNGNVISGGNDNTVLEHNGTSTIWSHSLHTEQVYSTHYDAPTDNVYSGARYGGVVAYDRGSNSQIWSNTLANDVKEVDANSDYVFAMEYDTQLTVLNKSDGSVVWSNNSFGNAGRGMDYNNGEVVAGADNIKAFDPATGNLNWEIVPEDTSTIFSIAYPDNSNVVFVGKQNGDVEGYDIDTGDKVFEHNEHGTNGVRALDANADVIYSGASKVVAWGHNVDGVGVHPVSGTVTDKEGNPIEGAAVGADHPDVSSTTTDSTGSYELDVPDPGTYDVTADDGDYVSTKTVDVPEGGISGVDFALGPANPDGQPVGLVEDNYGIFPADETDLHVYERSTEYKSVEEGMSVRTWHEETWTKTETAAFSWENRTHVDLVDGRYYRLELDSSNGNWEDSGFLYNESDMADSTIWLEPDPSSTDTNGDGTTGGSSSSGTNARDTGSSTPTPTADENGTYPTATEQQGFGPTALGTCETLDGQDGVEVEFWDPGYETYELRGNLTVDGSTTYHIRKSFDSARGYYRGCIADSMTENVSAERSDLGFNHTALDEAGNEISTGSESWSAPTFGPSGKAPASTGERLGLLAGVLGALGALWIGGNRVVPASSVRSWPSETINPAFGVGAPIVTVLGLDLAGGGVLSAGVATGLAQIAPFAGIVGVTIGGYAVLRWIRAPPS